MSHRAVLLSTCTAICWFAAPVLAEEFQTCSTKLPFHMSTKARAIDHKCGIGGDAEEGPKGLQNEAKNNLCSEGDVVTLTMADFLSLQRQAKKHGIPFGAHGPAKHRVEHLPKDRSELGADHFQTDDGRKVGEGTKVQMVAFMDDPHPGGTEDVNCQATEKADKDVHINLVESPVLPKLGRGASDTQKKKRTAIRNTALCKGIVAETIPHYRPTPFEARNLAAVAKQGFPVRISGQLFFDASHYPCDGSVPHPGGHPARGSLWEIHPVYSVDVCKRKTIDDCSPDNESIWVPIADMPIKRSRTRSWRPPNGLAATERALAVLWFSRIMSSSWLERH